MVATRKLRLEVRPAVLVAATRLFAAKGFDGTALQDVASAVGVSKPAVLHHFPSKEALRLAVLEAMLAHWKDRLPQLLLAATASADRFEAVYGELYRFFAEEPDRARLVMREPLDRPAEMRTLLTGAVRPWLWAIVSYIHEGQAHGRHQADVDAEAYVIQILLLVISAVATGEVLDALLPGDGKARQATELARLSRSGLFSPRNETGRKRPRRRSTPR